MINNIAFFIIFIFSLLISSEIPTCDYCNKNISGVVNILFGKKYHPSCYKNYVQARCEICSELITGLHNIIEDKRYHQNCYVNNVLEKCKVCNSPITGEYYEDYWGNIYHKIHEDNYSKCDNCNRIISQNITDGGYSINKERFICNICKPNVVKSQSQVDRSIKNVIIQLKNIGINISPDMIPITLVDTRNQLTKISNNSYNNIQGFTHYQEEMLFKKVISQTTHIYILSDLRLEIFESVLAHELCHVFIFMNRYKLNSAITEGFCNLASELIYENYNTGIAKYALESMYLDNHPDYGVGFKEMRKLLNKKGWYDLLEMLPNLQNTIK